MPLNALISFRSSISHTVDDYADASITFRAHQQGDVVTTAGETDDDIVQSHAIPIIYDPFPDNPLLRCVKVDVNRTSPIRVEWRADYEWKTSDIPGGIDPGGIPLTWSLRRSTRKSQTQIDRDILGRPIMTVTKESPNPPLNDELCDVAYVFSATGKIWNAGLLESYEDATNSDEFMGIAIGQAKIDDIQADVTFTQGQPPTANISLTVLVGRPPIITNLFEIASTTPEIAWQAASQPAAYYTWHKRWRAEGLKRSLGGTLLTGEFVNANTPGEDQVPRLHDPLTGSSHDGADPIKTTNARWYTHRTKVMLPFNTLFNIA